MTATHIRERVQHRDLPITVFGCGVVAALVAGLVGGRGFLIAVVVAFVGVAAVVDARSATIPNELVVVVLTAALARMVGVASAGNATVMSLGRDAAVGVVVSGGLAMFLVWLTRPQAVGGGDWKMLAAVGAAVGLIDLAAAAVVGVVAVAAQLVVSAVLRRRVLPFAPALLAGTAASALSTTWFHLGAGGWS